MKARKFDMKFFVSPFVRIAIIFISVDTYSLIFGPTQFYIEMFSIFPS